MTDEPTVSDHPDRRRFELRRGEEVLGFADYVVDGDVVVIPHVETRADLRGHGLGDRTMAGVADLVRADGRRIRPLCSFAAAFLAASPEHADLIAP